MVPFCTAGNSNLFQKNSMVCIRNNAVESSDNWEKPNGQEKK
jgi:hypothetical protein